MTWWMPVVAYIVGILFDTLYVGFYSAVSDKKAGTAALFSMAIGACSLTGIAGVVANHWLAPFLILGYGTGTYLTVRWKRQQEKKQA